MTLEHNSEIQNLKKDWIYMDLLPGQGRGSIAYGVCNLNTVREARMAVQAIRLHSNRVI